MFIILIVNPLFGQNNSETTSLSKSETSSYFSVNLNFISDAVYLGRKDSITAPYLNPSVIYHNKSGLYAVASFSYLTKANQSRVDLFLGSLGYDFTSNNLSGDFSITKYFFNTDSYNVISAIDADLSASLKYDLDLFYVSVFSTFFIDKSNDSDIFLSTEIGHDFLTSSKYFSFKKVPMKS